MNSITLNTLKSLSNYFQKIDLEIGGLFILVSIACNAIYQCLHKLEKKIGIEDNRELELEQSLFVH